VTRGWGWAAFLAAWNLGLRVGLARGTLKHRVVLL